MTTRILITCTSQWNVSGDHEKKNCMILVGYISTYIYSTTDKLNTRVIFLAAPEEKFTGPDDP